VFDVDRLVKEYLGTLTKLVLALGGEVLAGAALSAETIYLVMTLQIAVEALGYVLSLGYDTDARWHVAHNAIHQ
jgi:flagellar biosynthesis protein FliR